MSGSVRRLSCLAGGVAAVTLCLPATAVAQEQAPAGPSWFRMNVLHVRADRMDDMKEIQKRITASVKARGNADFRSVWQTGQYGDTYTLYVFQPIQKFADFDTGPIGAERRGRRDVP